MRQSRYYCVIPPYYIKNRRIIRSLILKINVGLEPTRSLLTRRFSCHTCFYTSILTSITRISSFSIQYCYQFVLRTGVEPVQPFLVKGFSYHTCFYTSQLKDFLVYSKASRLELFRHFCSSLSCCGLDYFITLSINFEVRN